MTREFLEESVLVCVSSITAMNVNNTFLMESMFLFVLIILKKTKKQKIILRQKRLAPLQDFPTFFFALSQTGAHFATTTEMALAAAATASRARVQSREDSENTGIEMESLEFPQAGEILSDIVLEQMMVDGYVIRSNVGLRYN
jgi:hypothetical protein